MDLPDKSLSVLRCSLRLSASPFGRVYRPTHTRVLCTVEKVAARLCSFDEHNALMYGGALVGLGAIVFLVGLGLDRAGRR